VRVFVLAAAAGLVSLASAVSGPSAGPRVNRVQAENALPGSSGWQTPAAPAHAIEGYTSEVSVAPGETLHLHVSTSPAARYRVEIYRLGWYGGTGGRLEACLPSCEADEAGTPQPLAPPAANGYLDAGWPITDAIRVPGTWVSGYFLAVLRLSSGAGGWIPFVVRAPARQRSAILVQAAVNTWQAYNRWGGMSLYKNADGTSCKGVCTRVSFNRPYDPTTQNLWSFEVPLVHFLEQSGYDVSYVTDVDVDRDPGQLLRHRLVVTAGHDEYWTKAIRDGFDHARTLGTNLAFMGANTGYWQMRYANARRTIVEYRLRRLDPEADPALKTVRFRDLVPPRPECELEGVQYVRSGEESIGGQHDYVPASAALGDPWFAGTGFTQAGVLPELVGYEWDAVQPGCRSPVPTVLFHYPGPPAPADAVRFTASSGAQVFSAGSLSFAKGLDEFPAHTGAQPSADPRLEAFVRNAFAELLQPAQPRGLRGTVGTALKAFRDGPPG
jgi:N,N-dimethylformamidase beta subunit-like protein